MITLSFVVQAITHILVSGFILWLSIRILEGLINLKKAFLFSAVMFFINFSLSFLLPFIPLTIPFLSLIIYSLIWFVLATQVIHLGLVKGIVVALIQVVLSIVLPVVNLSEMVLGLIPF